MKCPFIITVTAFSICLNTAAQTNTVTVNATSNTTANATTNTTPKLIAENEAPSLTTQKKKHSIGHKFLFYLPNRALDLVDILRFRAKVGPGLAANLNVTSLASFYGGTHNVVYAGLPGPRCAMKKPRPWGREQQKGLILFGVDATDDTLHSPEHSTSEIGIGLHLLVVGVDAGIDPVEIGDFLAGLIGKDPKGDDR